MYININIFYYFKKDNNNIYFCQDFSILLTDKFINKKPVRLSTGFLFIVLIG